MLYYVRQAFDILLTATNGAQTVVSSIFSLSHAIGFFIVKYILLCYTTLADIVLTAVNVLSVLYEDFCVFITDLSGKFADICLLLFGTATSTVYTIKNGILAIKYSIWYIYESTVNFCQLVIDSIAKSFGIVIDLAELAKWSVILIGRGFWLAIQLIPLCILYLFYSIASLITYIVVTTYEHIDATVFYVTNKLTLAGQWTVSYLFDFPLESVLGLVLGYALIFTLYKYHARIGRAIAHSIWRTFRLMRTTIICFWFLVQHNSFQPWRLFRRAAPAPAVDSDSDSTQDDEPVVPVRRSTRLQARTAVKPAGKVNPEQLQRQLQQEQEEKLCVVCQDQNKCVLVIPCRHLCLCSDCSTVIHHTTRSCPICRQRVDKVLAVYM